MDKVVSPITKNTETELIDKIPISKIVDLYSIFKTNVKRFFENINEVEIRKCTKTGYRFYYPANIYGDGKFYEDLQTQDADYYPTDKWEHKIAEKFIDSNTQVLEIGCATGIFLDKCVAKNAQVRGLEFNEKALQISKVKGYNVTSEFLEEHAKGNKNLYDYVCSFQVLEHIYDVNSYFINALSCLKPNGKLIIGVPNSNPYIFKHDKLHTLNLPPHHAGLWNKNCIIKVADHFNLKVDFIAVSPIEEYKDWYIAQKSHYLKAIPPLGLLMSIIPRPIYKRIVKLFAKQIEGKTLLAILSRR